MTGDSHAAIQGVLELQRPDLSGPYGERSCSCVRCSELVYRPHNLGHDALGAEAYCHFTSPIRRYADLLGPSRPRRCCLRAKRAGHPCGARAGAAPGGDGRPGHAACSADGLPGGIFARGASPTLRRATPQKVKVAQYYAQRVGERMAATVTWIDQMGAFVRVDETAAQGLVAYERAGRQRVGGSSMSVALLLPARLRARSSRLVSGQSWRFVGADCMRGHLNFKLIHTLSISGYTEKPNRDSGGHVETPISRTRYREHAGDVSGGGRHFDGIADARASSWSLPSSILPSSARQRTEATVP